MNLPDRVSAAHEFQAVPGRNPEQGAAARGALRSAGEGMRTGVRAVMSEGGVTAAGERWGLSSERALLPAFRPAPDLGTGVKSIRSHAGQGAVPRVPAAWNRGLAHQYGTILL